MHDKSVHSESTTPNRGGFHLGRFLRNAAIITIAIGLGVLAWYVFLVDHVHPKNFGVVVPGVIYRSGRPTPTNLERTIEELGIKTVIDLGAFDPDSPEERRIAEAAAEAGAARYQFRFKGDGRGDPGDYVEVLRIMADPESQPVLVHCAAGAQRTGMAVVLYRTIVQDKPFDGAYAETRQYGHDPEDNARFLEYLREWRERIESAYDTGQEIEAAVPE